MLCAALRLLLQLMAHTVPPPGEAHEAAAMRALLAHQLLLGPCTHSELAASLRSIDDEAPSPEVVQAAIDAVATKQQEAPPRRPAGAAPWEASAPSPSPAQASSGAARLYALREGLEADYYSPVFPHLTVESHQARVVLRSHTHSPPGRTARQTPPRLPNRPRHTRPPRHDTPARPAPRSTPSSGSRRSSRRG